MIMRKFVALLLVILMAILMVGCEATNEWLDDVPGKNPTGNPDAKYWGYVVLESYDEVSRLLEIEKNRYIEEDGSYIKEYWFDDNLADYKTVYYFEAVNTWMTYPISLDDYFAEKNIVTRNSYLIDESDGYCDCGCSHEPIRYIPEEQSNYLMYPYISINKAPRLMETEIIPIEDTSLITYEYSFRLPGGRHKYICSYDGVEAFVIESCRELSQETLEKLLEHIIFCE